MKVRYLIKFTKDSDIKFISHLDLMRTLQRIIRRSKLNVEYSQGFNPHMNTSLCQPLSVGVYSSSEYLDIYLEEKVKTIELIEALNKVSSRGIKFLYAAEVKENMKSSMALLSAAKYNIKIKYEETENLQQQLGDLFHLANWNIVKKSKSSEKEVDIKPYIYKMGYKIEKGYLIITAVLAAGSRDNLSADLLSKFIIENTEGYKKDSFVLIKRVEMYAKDGDKFIPLDKYCTDSFKQVIH